MNSRLKAGMPATAIDSRDPRASREQREWRRTKHFLTLASLLVIVALGGGSSRPDTLSLLYVRPVAVFCFFLLLLGTVRRDYATVRLPLVLLALLALLALLQLVPLPPAIWSELPGRDILAQGEPFFAQASVWQPLSMTPDLTLAGFFDLFVPASILIAFAALDETRRRWLLIAALAIIGCSALVGILQVAGIDVLYLYRVTSEGNPAVGLFANRNHQAALLALGFPLLRALNLGDSVSPRAKLVVLWSSAVFSLLLIPLILVTGSRAGIFLGLISAAATVAMAPLDLSYRRKAVGKARGPAKAIIFAIAAAAVAFVIAGVIMTGRAESFNRLAQGGLSEEMRFVYAPLTFAMMLEYLPFGSGFGSFAPAFAMYEPDWLLEPRYVNRAHNDAVELVIGGGLPALLLLLVFLAWWIGRSWHVFFRCGRSAETALGRAAAIIILVLLIASVVDYPLATPLMAAVMAVACGWLGTCARPSVCVGS